MSDQREISMRSVRIVVGFPAGGPLDIAARTVAPFLARHLGQQVVVENRPGESGNSAALEVVRAAPDGRTLLLCGPVNTINVSLFKRLDFDFARDITQVASIARVPLIVEVHPSVPVRSLPEFITFARADPGRVRVAFAGIGTPQHLGIALFQSMTGVRLTLVPYSGSAPALTDLLRGAVDVMFDPAPSSMPHIRAGSLVPVATTGLERAEMLPEVPTVAEIVPGYEAGSWFSLGAPRGTPRDVVDRLNTAMNEVLSDPMVAALFRELGASLVTTSPAELDRFIGREIEKYRRILSEAGSA